MKVLCFGSLNIDYVYQVNEFVRPGETISARSYAHFPGGKGLNQSIALASAGADTYHAGCIGQDGEFLEELLLRRGVKTQFLKKMDQPTGHAVIQVDRHGQNCILLFGGANQSILEAHIDETLKGFTNGDYLLLQNEINHIGLIIEKAYDKGMKIVLNPSPFNHTILNLPLGKISIFVMNEIEGAGLTGENDADSIIRVMASRYPFATIVLTLGKRGVIAFDGGRSYFHGIYNVPVVDTTAAGDTFTGFMIGMLACGEKMEKSLEIASKASSISVSVSGAANSIPLLNSVKSSKLMPVL